MKRTNDKPLGDAIREMLDSYKLNDKLLEVKIINSWEVVVGKMISKHTERLYIKKKKLYVKLDSPALKTELSFAKEKIVKSLNEEVGADVIGDVVFI